MSFVGEYGKETLYHLCIQYTYIYTSMKEQANDGVDFSKVRWCIIRNIIRLVGRPVSWFV